MRFDFETEWLELALHGYLRRYFIQCTSISVCFSLFLFDMFGNECGKALWLSISCNHSLVLESTKPFFLYFAYFVVHVNRLWLFVPVLLRTLAYKRK